jgi:hypothetical protein
MNTLTKLALGLIGQLKADPAQAGAADAIVLPPANTAGGLPLMQAMALRQSQREFAPEPSIFQFRYEPEAKPVWLQSSYRLTGLKEAV